MSSKPVCLHLWSLKMEPWHLVPRIQQALQSDTPSDNISGLPKDKEQQVSGLTPPWVTSLTLLSVYTHLKGSDLLVTLGAG